jgi:hypothetical protein
VGGSGGVRGTDSAGVPGLPAASDRHPRHDRAMAPGPGQATLDPTSPSHRRPSHGARTAPVGPAAGRRELHLGLPAHPRRTCWAWLPDSAQHGVVDPQASRHRPRAAMAPPGDNSWPPRHGAFSPPTSSASTRCWASGCMSCSSQNTPPAACTFSASRRTPAAPGSPSRHATS